MTITPDDPRLTALALGELPEEEAALLYEKVAASPELREEFDHIRSLSGFLGDSLGQDSLTLGEERREEIFRAGQRPDSEALIIESHRRNRRHTFKVILGAAAVLTLGFVFLNKTFVATPSGLAQAEGEGMGESGASATQLQGSASALQGFPEGKILTVREQQSLPLSFSNLDTDAVRTWLYHEKKWLPDSLASPLAWINQVSSVEEAQLVSYDLGISSELAECPWDASKTLLLVSVQSQRSMGEAAHQVRGSLSLQSERIISSKLISDGTVSHSDAGMVSLKAGENRLLLYELSLKSGAGRLGSLEIETVIPNGEERVAYLPITEQATQSRSQTMERVTLMAQFALTQKMASEQASRELTELAQKAELIYSEVEDEKTRLGLDLILLARDLIVKGGDASSE